MNLYSCFDFCNGFFGELRKTLRISEDHKKNARMPHGYLMLPELMIVDFMGISSSFLYEIFGINGAFLPPLAISTCCFLPDLGFLPIDNF
jgi:hypothetical protein